MRPRQQLKTPITREKLIEAYIDVCFDNFKDNRESVETDWLEGDEAAAKEQALSLSDSELRLELGLPIPDRFALFNKPQSEYTYDNAESYNRDANTP